MNDLLPVYLVLTHPEIVGDRFGIAAIYTDHQRAKKHLTALQSIQIHPMSTTIHQMHVKVGPEQSQPPLQDPMDNERDDLKRSGETM